MIAVEDTAVSDVAQFVTFSEASKRLVNSLSQDLQQIFYHAGSCKTLYQLGPSITEPCFMCL